MKINARYLDLQESYLFANIARKVADYQQAHPDAKILRLGIGDVTRPLAPQVVAAMRQAVDEMGGEAGFRGYGPEQGYAFLRQAIVENYARRAVALAPDEVFVSDGAKSDLGNLLDIFDVDNTVLIPDPVYPVYVDTNIMAGRRIAYLHASAANAFLPMPQKDTRAGIIYLCSPNNPTGAVYDRTQLKAWVDYANTQGAVILFDAAYEAFIQGEDYPRSIYEISGAETCAIEVCSLSKTAGFTGVRCGYTVVPKALVRQDAALNHLWLRRQTTKFNGVSYIVQRGAEAAFTPEGRAQCMERIAYYRKNCRIIATALDACGVRYTGGTHAPYIWMQCPDGMDSWQFFDALLAQAHIVGTPGAGFGANGEGFFRLSGFGSRETALRAAEALQAFLRA
nr:LL-diaminopimelate aminotransferase [Maliibacterium massiliense]